jgi:hypothetical protein
MKKLTLFLGDSDVDTAVKYMLEQWSAANPSVTLTSESIHTDPTPVVRLGITELPALVLDEEVIAQGAPEKWVLPLLDRVFTPDATGD